MASVSPVQRFVRSSWRADPALVGLALTNAHQLLMVRMTAKLAAAPEMGRVMMPVRGRSQVLPASHGSARPCLTSKLLEACLETLVYFVRIACVLTAHPTAY